MGTANSHHEQLSGRREERLGSSRNVCNAFTVFQGCQVKTLELSESQATWATLVQLQSETDGPPGACFWKHCPGSTKESHRLWKAHGMWT